MPEPKVSRQGNKLHISYEYAHRIHTSRIYPFPSPNGSTIIISATSKGIYIAWNGGKPLYFTSKSEGPVLNGTNHNRPGNFEVSQDPESDDEALFESDEEEIDDGQPHTSVVQDLHLQMSSPVLHLALPELPSASSLRSDADVPSLFEESIVLAASCADGSTRLVTLPSTPPSAASKRKRRLGAHICLLGDNSRPGLPRGLSMTWTSSSPADLTKEPASRPHTRSTSRSHAQEPQEVADFSILVALATSDLAGQLDFFRVPVHLNGDNSIVSTRHVSSFQTQSLPSYPTRIAFNTSAHPSWRHSQLLIADVEGCLRIYDPLAPKGSINRPSSRDSQASQAVDLGAWSMTFTTSFRMPKDCASTVPSLSQRKKLLDAQWICGGRSILALVEDGEWGIWDVEGVNAQSHSKATTSPLDFAFRGFIGDAVDTSSALGSKPKNRTQLAPMTPNTRRTRQENLFNGPVKHLSAAARGGVSIRSVRSNHSTTEESAVLWYGDKIYTITDVMALWQRSASSSSRDIGTLYGAGLSRVDDVDITGEIINCVNQLPSRSAALSSGLGSISQTDLLITAEHRFVVLASARSSLAPRSLFAREAESPSLRQDQLMLDSGDLDLGGMDRLLDGMAGTEKTGAFGKGKRVGFAAH